MHYPPVAATKDIAAPLGVTGNVIEDGPGHGLRLGWGPDLRNVVASGNIIRKVRVGIAVTVMDGAGATVISDNIIDSAPGGAIVGFHRHDAVTGDLAGAGDLHWRHLTIQRNRTG